MVQGFGLHTGGFCSKPVLCLVDLMWVFANKSKAFNWLFFPAKITLLNNLYNMKCT